MKMSPEEVIKNSDHLFEAQSVMLPLWQTLAEHFYPERADFTVTRNVGTELADNLIDSYPILARRDMGNSLSAMLRDGNWVEMTTNSEPGDDDRRWLQWATGRMLKVFEFRDSNFVRATKEADHDYVTFGQPVLSCQLNRKRNGLLFQSWHLRDCAWMEDENGQVCAVHRKWQPTAWHLTRMFREEVLHDNVTQSLRDQPYKEFTVRHIVMPASLYRDEQIEQRFEYVSLFIDVQNMHVMEEIGLDYNPYIVPRFQTISGSPYAYSPATVVALPESRLLQAMTHTLLEAGERYARPPIIATQQVVRSDVDLSSDGITWVDKEYDERLGAAMRPLTQDRGGFPIGLELRADIKEILSSAFYLNKITLPPTDHEMTAYEVSERMKQFRRENLPLFAPIEAEYNGKLCEQAFSLMFRNGMLGAVEDVPEGLQGNEVLFKFKSPLSASEEEEKANRFAQVRQILAEAAELDPGARNNVDIDTALREAVVGVGAPQRWLFDREVVAERKIADQAQAIGQQMLQQGVGLGEDAA